MGHLIFDLDGTLIDSSDGVVEAVNYSLRALNQPEQPPERIKRFIGFPLSRMYPEFTAVPFQELYRHFQVRAAETMVAAAVPLDGVEASLAELRRAGFRMAIATTKIRRHVDGILAKFGWQELFAATVGGDEVEAVKPAPDAFRLALARLGTTAADAIVIGDTINDVLAARGVPMPVIGVVSPYGDRAELEASRPDLVMEAFSELPALLKGHAGRGGGRV